jgi:hypothetical protein
MTSTIVLLVLAWAVTVPVVLGLARLLGRLSSPEPVEVPVAPAPAPPADNVVALVPRPRNALLSARDAELRRAS